MTATLFNNSAKDRFIQQNGDLIKIIKINTYFNANSANQLQLVKNSINLTFFKSI